MKDEAKTWLEANTGNMPIGDQQEAVVNTRKLHVWLGVQEKYSQWIQKRIRERKFKEGKDYCLISAFAEIKNQGGDRRSKDYYLTIRATKEIAASDNSPKGRALLHALLDLQEAVERGDVDLVEYMVEKQESPQDTERVIKTSQQRTIELYRRQGKSEQWIANRLQSMTVRNFFTDTLKRRYVCEPKHYAAITNRMNKVLFGKTAQELKDDRGYAKTARDLLTMVELSKVQLAEAMSSEAMDAQNSQGYASCFFACDRETKRVAQI